jgi:hypothetical protein
MSSNIPGITLGDVSVQAQAPAAAQASPLQVPYAVRQINLTFQLGTGSFGAGGQNTLTASGLQVVCHVEAVVFPQMGGILTMKVYGMTLDQMNAISVAGLLWAGRQNTVLVQAGDATLGLSTVFKGLIVEAYPVLDTAQDAHFYVHADVWTLARLKPVSPTSYPGAVPAASAIEGMAKTAGFNFQNDGVTGVLNAPYFPGTIGQQVAAAVRAANCFAYLDGATNTLVIWPKNAATPPTATIVVSPASGMIGYPKFQKNTIIVTTLFNPQIALRPSLSVLVQSQLAAANNAKLTITKVSYDLASQLPGGPWEATIEGVPPP